MELNNSTVLITGGTSGIGLEFVKQLLAQGANIIVTGRDLKALRQTQENFPLIHIFQSDVSKPEQIEQLYKEVTQAFPQLNILINNAGLMRQLDLQEATLDLDNINCEISTNLSGTIDMVHRFLPHLLQQKTAAIVNVSSGIAFVPYSIAPIYSAAKAGVHAYTQALRLQLNKTSVKVFELMPPGVKTNIHNNWKLKPPERRLMQVDKMVEESVRGILKDKTEIRPGLTKMIQLMSRLAPGFSIKLGHKEFEKLKALGNSH